MFEWQSSSLHSNAYQVEAWTTTHALLQSPDVPVEAKLFAATTLKGKIVFDLDQLPPDSVLALRDSVLNLLVAFASGPRPIQTQLCVCLASLAIQMIAWKDVLATVASALGSNAGDCVLEFLKILPEEVTEGRKINLSEDELLDRTKELLEDNAEQVMQLMIQYAQSSPSAATNPRLLDCITSWLREIPAAKVVESPLMDIIIKALDNDVSFDAGVDCLCTLYRDTRDVDESLPIIQALYPRLMALRPKIAETAEAEDLEAFKGITRMFSEAGEAWAVLIARLPAEFRGLVEAVLECSARDWEREAVSLTFIFWYELKQQITIEKFVDAPPRIPHPEEGETDLFGGDREQEEKFRQFRHSMGDVLKDCCAVVSTQECLAKIYQLIQQWVAKYASQASNEHVPHWQELEAPLFGLRAMGRMVDPEENTILNQLVPLIVQIPDQEKVRFQAIMALARYTEWTAQHPETLEAQLNYVISAFHHSSQEVVQAAALAFKFLGTDCQKLLGGHISQLHAFFESVLDKLKPTSQEEVTEGVAAVVSVQPLEKIYDSFKMFCDPIMARIMNLANNAQDEEGQRAVADHLQLITIFVQIVTPIVPFGEENPAVKYVGEILPIMTTIVMNFTSSTPILERVCRCWRYMIISYRTAMIPLLPTLAQSIASGFEASREGCFLWATDAVVREFSDGADYVDQATSDAVFQFYEQQALAFLRILNDLPPENLPDGENIPLPRMYLVSNSVKVIEDFFRLSSDAVRYYPKKCISSSLAVPIFSAALSALTLQQVDPLIATLHYYRDLFGFAFDKPLVSEFTTPEGEPYTNPPEVREAVKALIASQGQPLAQRVLTGMMFTFPGDCFPDASGVVMTMFELLPHETGAWLQTTLQMLPVGTMKPGEAERLLKNISDKVQSGETRKIRVLLQDFTNSYRRRNVAPRDGLGRLEATRFRFSG
ncbi:hypothetical protein N7448_005651 [Penicillium atrosanguineum]|nr:hypothetical protein N7448_005651 [Penicillium atrosanguineum]